METKCVVCGLECKPHDSSGDVIHKGFKLASVTSSSAPQPYVTVTETTVYRYEASEPFSYHNSCVTRLKRRRAHLLYALLGLGLILTLGALLAPTHVTSRGALLSALALAVVAIMLVASAIAYSASLILPQTLNPTQDDMGHFAAGWLPPVASMPFILFIGWYESSYGRPVPIFGASMVVLGACAFSLLMSLLTLYDCRREIDQLTLAHLAARRFRLDPAASGRILWNFKEFKKLGFKI